MKQYKFSLKDERMKELPLYENPDEIKDLINVDYYNHKKQLYECQLKSLQSIPVAKEYLNQFEDGKIYSEDEFQIKTIVDEEGRQNQLRKGNCIVRNYIRTAIPKQKVDDTELWKGFFDKIFDWNYGISNYLSKKDFINELQKHYTITRK